MDQQSSRSPDFETARRKYIPSNIKFLLVAEAPPPENSRRFFYFENVSMGDSLFLELMKVLYHSDSLKPQDVRRQKRRFLQRFRDDGFYLIDSSDTPIIESTQKRHHIERALPSLRRKLLELAPDDVKIILISKNVYEVCAEKLKTEGFNIINDEMIDFPGSGGQERFRRKLGRLLRNHGWSAGCMA